MRTIPHSVRAHYGTCDASAAVALGEGLFVLANDEDNILRLYHSSEDGPPLGQVNLTEELGLTKNDEADLEAAATLGKRVFWIGSHDRNDDGDRYRFFATKFDVQGETPRVRLIGRPYTKLLSDLLGDKRFAGLKLRKASRKNPKEKGGLAIEGLAATPSGKLLIGLRNPIRGGCAIVAKLKNPADVVRKGKRCRFGKPILLNLDGLGIRSIAYCSHRKCYLIVAGPYGAKADFRLFTWSGKRKSAPVEVLRFSLTWYVEAMLLSPGGRDDELMVISDDGQRRIGCSICKQRNEEDRFFRSGLICLPLEA